MDVNEEGQLNVEQVLPTIQLPSEGGTIVSEVLESLFENEDAIVNSRDQGIPEGSALEGTLPAQNVSESSAPAPLFDGNDPNAVFHVLKMITASERYSVGGDKPKVPKTYKAWGKLNPNQKFKVISCYNSLDVVWKTALLAKVGDYVDPVGNSTVTTKNDLVRLLELRDYSGAIVAWTKALGVLNRQELDAKKSKESDERDDILGPWNTLATLFNNRSINSDFQPYNRAGIIFILYIYSNISLIRQENKMI